jgi:hypothetical protein
MPAGILPITLQGVCPALDWVVKLHGPIAVFSGRATVGASPTTCGIDTKTERRARRQKETTGGPAEESSDDSEGHADCRRGLCSKYSSDLLGYKTIRVFCLHSACSHKPRKIKRNGFTISDTTFPSIHRSSYCILL